MIRKAFVMTLRPGSQEEYIKRHNPIWPELRQVLKAHGVRQYSIFLDRQADRLFACAVVESEESWQRIATTEACQRWWAHMKELMLTNPDNSPAATVMEEVFYLD
ncbi:MAG TPA: L-rhamnose mutarotase [Blastocatellia bacterium]|nr:L-rhamnose mutarotase [Blastocatellia bacterium]